MNMNKNMSLAALAREVHANAVAKGFWEKPDPDNVYGLIHGEWSEALEEARAGRPDRWYWCKHDKRAAMCTDNAECELILNVPCLYRDAKPEGIAVELIDGVIRILDYYAHAFAADLDIDLGGTLEYYMEPDADDPHALEEIAKGSVGELVCTLHHLISHAWIARVEGRKDREAEALLLAVVTVCVWIRGRGIDPADLLAEKHAYNTTRSYKHGKLF